MSDFGSPGKPEGRSNRFVATPATDELELLYRLSSVALRPNELEHTLSQSLSAIVAGLGADAGEIWLHDPDMGVVRMTTLHGRDRSFLERREFLVGEGVPGAAVATRTPLSIDIRHDRRFLRRSVAEAGFSVFHAIPMLAGETTPGVLCLAYRALTTLDGRSQRLLSIVADQLGLVIRHDALRSERESARVRLAGLAVRDRVARELHDQVMQSLFAATIELQATWKRDQRDGPAFEKSINDLRTIGRDLRSLIVQLEQEPQLFQTTGGLHSRLTSLIGTGSSAPTWRIEFAMDHVRLDPRVEVELYLLIRELVANVYAHASASLATLSVKQVDDQILLQVTDNGVGFVPAAVGSRSVGLRVASRRAEGFGGSLKIESAPSSGTTIVATLPVASLDEELA